MVCCAALLLPRLPALCSSLLRLWRLGASSDGCPQFQLSIRHLWHLMPTEKRRKRHAVMKMICPTPSFSHVPLTQSLQHAIQLSSLQLLPLSKENFSSTNTCLRILRIFFRVSSGIQPPRLLIRDPLHGWRLRELKELLYLQYSLTVV